MNQAYVASDSRVLTLPAGGASSAPAFGFGTPPAAGGSTPAFSFGGATGGGATDGGFGFGGEGFCLECLQPAIAAVAMLCLTAEHLTACCF